MVVVGLDEVGRGCWAGPLVVGAVAVDEDFLKKAHELDIKLDDSKKLTKLQRSRSAKFIKDNAVSCSLAAISAARLDKLGLAQSLKVAFKQAYIGLDQSFIYDKIIVDGNINYLSDLKNSSCFPKADSLEVAVAAASILAKVYRDNFMTKLAVQFPNYLFDKNVGYGTQDHAQALNKYGVSQLHRLSFKPMKDMI